jgi:hypothetical protein
MNEYPQEKEEGGASEATKPQPKRTGRTVSKAPLRVSCVQYVSPFNKKMDSGICM